MRSVQRKIKGVAPTHQYVPIPNYAVQQASESYGKVLVQTFEREGWKADTCGSSQLMSIIHYC